MINGLVLSVGVLVQNGPNILPSGHEVMFATNVMGPFLFTPSVGTLQYQTLSFGVVPSGSDATCDTYDFKIQS